MTAFDRREFFGASIAGSVSAWFAGWFGQDPQGQPKVSEAEKALRVAVQKAKDQGKPLLVFVVPPDPASRESGDRSRWLAAWLDHGGPAALLEVALCVPVCATLEDLCRVTGAAKIDGDPVMLVVDVTQVGTGDAPQPRVTIARVETPSLPDWSLPHEVDEAAFDAALEKARAEEEQAVRAGIERFTAALHAALHRHGASTAKLVDDVRTKAGATRSDVVAKWIEGGATPGDDTVLHFAAEIRSAAARGSDAQRERLTTALREAARRQFLEGSVAGSYWQFAHCFSCGMGHVPALCDRFLVFFTAL